MPEHDDVNSRDGSQGGVLDRLADAIEHLAPSDDNNPHVRRRRIVNLLGHGDFVTAEGEIRELLDEQWKVPENVYLLGILFLFQGRFEVARAAIDHAIASKPWLTEVPIWCGDLRERVIQAEAFANDWLWPIYRRRLDTFETFGMTLTSVLSSRFEHRDVQLVQVGANDGVSTDPMYGWINKFDWKALLLEPMTDPYRSLDLEYAGRERVVTVNAAIAEANERRTMWTHPGDRHAVSTFTPDRNLLRSVNERRAVDVNCRTFSSLFEEHAIERVDILQIDTEGFDFEVLKLFELHRFHPDVIHMEFYLLPLEDRLALFDHLETFSYAWRMLGADLLAVDIESFADRFGLVRS